MNRLIAFAAVLAAAASILPAHAHRCGPPEITIRVGQCATWEITADVEESEKSDYGLVSPPGPQAHVRPGDPNAAFTFSKFNLGVYRICGEAVGTTSLTASWEYAPNMAGGNCPLSITVLPESQAPGSNGDGTDSGEDGDPVNTFSGELFALQEPDLRLDGPMPLAYQRYYSSSLPVGGVREGRLGAGWTDNLSITLSGDSDRIDVDFRYGQRLRFELDAGQWQRVSPAAAAFQLVEDGSDYLLMDPADQRIYRFDATGRLQSISDRNGNALQLAYDAGGQGEVPVSLSDGLGRQLDFTIAGFQFFDEVGDGTRSVDFSLAFATATANHLASAVDAAGETTTYSYLPTAGARPGLLTGSVRPEGNTPLVTAWDAGQRVDSQSNAAAQAWSFDWSGDTIVTAPDGATTVHVHDAAGRQVGLTNNAAETRMIGYDGAGRRDLVVNELGDSRSMSWHAASGYIAGFTDEDGQATSYSYAARTDADGLVFHDLVGIDFADGRGIDFSRDPRGNLTGYSEPGGASWSVTVNARGQPTAVTTPLGGTRTRSYRADGMLMSATDAGGHTTSYAYDPLWRTSTITRPDSSTRSFSWTSFDRIASVTDELGAVTSYQYDGNGRLEAETDVAGNTLGYGYDTSDRLVTVTDRLGQTRTRSYDAGARPGSDSLGNGEIVAYGYDARGYLSSTTVPSGDVWSFGNDPLGRIVSITDPESAVTGFDHDPLGRITGIDWPEGGTQSFAYDPLGRLLSQTDAEGRATGYRYDAPGRLAGIDVPDASLDVTTNPLGLTTAVEDPNGNHWTWGYDSAGRLAAATDPLGAATSYSHDNRGRWSAITYPGGLGSESLDYDARNHLLQRDFSDGTLIQYGYDVLGRLSSGSNFAATYDAEGRMIASNGLTVSRQPATGRIASIAWPGGPTVSYGYDAGGRLATIDDGLGGVTGFSHDGVGRITAITRPNGVASSFEYDGNGRLVRVVHGAFVDLQLVRDHSGMVVEAVRDQPTHYAVPEATLSQSADAALRISGLPHDALGRLQGDGNLAYSHDLASRLATRDDDGSVASYDWDALFRLVSRAEGGTTTGFTWNYATAQPAIATTSSNGTPDAYYVSLPDGRLLYRIDAGSNARQYFHFDELGNTLAVTDAAGSVVASWGYSPYGRRSGAGAVAGHPLTFGGENSVLTDAAGRLYVMGARLYDAQRMRFASRDRIAPQLHPLAFNPYGFAAGNPMYFIDPSGDNPQAGGGPTALDVVGELNGVVGAAGTTQGVVEEAARANLNGARQTTAQLGRQFAQGGQAANQARGPLNQAATAQRNAQRAVNQASTRGMKALGNLGNAATFLGGLIEAYKLNGKLNRHEADWSRSVQNAFEDAERASENAFRSYKEGNITMETLRTRLETIRELLDERLENEDDLYNINVAISGADATFNFLMGLAPGGDKLYSGLKGVLGVSTD